MASTSVANNQTIAVGDAAPDFTLPSQSGTQLRLSDIWRERPVVLFFYPKDDSMGCTREACGFRDSYDVFKQAGAEVIGISSDTVQSHAHFASRNNLPFILLSDAGGKIRRLFGVARSFGILPGRVTYVIDTQGVVRRVFVNAINPTQHVADALQTIKSLTGSGPS